MMWDLSGEDVGGGEFLRVSSVGDQPEEALAWAGGGRPLEWRREE